MRGWLGISARDPIAEIGVTGVSILIVFILDAVVIALMFRWLSGLRPSARALWPGAILGAIGLSVLQQLSNLFVGGASNNPLLASFASLIALLLWLNLSSQVILIAGAYIVTGVDEETDRVKARFGASTFAQRRVRRAEIAVMVAASELDAARREEAKERGVTRRLTPTRAPLARWEGGALRLASLAQRPVRAVTGRPVADHRATPRSASSAPRCRPG